ncbi:MAG: LPXTG cell wall anchor domain-containing protein [Lachnospiraceae bacterium]|nr:LPXTG cell wall anchor domain-containing protein [Lachnospiraceae bacterium]
MKKKILALISVAVLTFGMSMTAFAANSPAASTTPAASSDVVVSTPAGQAVTEAQLENWGSVTVTSGVGATTQKATDAQATTLVNAAVAAVGNNAKVATIVDIVVPAGTGEAAFSIPVDGVVEGMAVTVIHLKSDGTTEILNSTAKNGRVEFIMTSYSPIIIVLNATAPKTGATNTTVYVLVGLVALAGSAVCIKRYRR